ncbi:MAG: hypothetical protein ACTSXH_16905 [Promethearchaeota archaeon]
MKDKRIIRIQDPKLQKIRNEFRKLLLAWKNDVIRKLEEQRRALNIDPDGKLIIDMDEATLKKFHELQETVANIRAWASQSILRCRTCGQTDKDMQYNKGSREWFCSECIEKHRKMRNILIAKKGRGEYLYDLEDDDYYDTFK